MRVGRGEVAKEDDEEEEDKEARKRRRRLGSGLGELKGGKKQEAPRACHCGARQLIPLGLGLGLSLGLGLAHLPPVLSLRPATDGQNRRTKKKEAACSLREFNSPRVCEIGNCEIDGASSILYTRF